MRNIVLRAAAAWVGLMVVSCGGDGQPTSHHALDTLQCPAGQIPFNFSTVDPFTGEGLRQGALDAGNLPQPEPPNTVRITSGVCGGRFDMTAEVRESCQGKQSCAFTTNTCFNNEEITITYSCTKDPNTFLAQQCPAGSVNCLFTISCPQTFPAVEPTGTARVACVPEHCNAFERRDTSLNCVFDDTKKEEWWQVGVEGRALTIFPDDLTLRYRSVRRDFYFPTGGSAMRLDRTKIKYFNFYDDITNSRWAALQETQLAQYRTLLAGARYRLNSTYSYPAPRKNSTAPLNGVLTIWVTDLYKTKTGEEEQGFRCVLHTVDLSKYQGTYRGGGTDQWRVTLDEEILVPAGCADDGPAQLDNEAMLAKRHDMDLFTFRNTYRRQRARVRSSYDILGQVSSQHSDAYARFCAPNPTGFFFDAKTRQVDRVKYYSQLEALVTTHFGPFGETGLEFQEVYKILRDEVFILPANETAIGMSQALPKKLSYKVQNSGDPRGSLRFEAVWYLNADRGKFWSTEGLANDKFATHITGFLVPLDDAGKPLADTTHLRLGSVRALASSSFGANTALKFPVTADIRNALRRGSLAVLPSGTRNYRFKACIELKEGVNFYEPAGYTLSVGADRCRVSDVPFEIRLDSAVEFMEPDGSTEGFDDSDGATSGDSRSNQTQDNDTFAGCSTSSGLAEARCDARVRMALGGTGNFGRSWFDVVLGVGIDAAPTAPALRVYVRAALAGWTIIDFNQRKAIAADAAGRLQVPFPIPSPWALIATELREASPTRNPLWQDGTVAYNRAGDFIEGVYLQWETVTPVSWGFLQGLIIYGPTVGQGCSNSVAYGYVPSSLPTCPLGASICQDLFVLQDPAPLTKAAELCYARGGRLAELRTADQYQYILGRMSQLQGRPVWLGAQIANRYTNSNCASTWIPSQCSVGHEQFARWLSNDRDFASASSFGSYALVSNQIYTPTGGYQFGREPASVIIPPLNQGVTFSPQTNALGATNASTLLPSICQLSSATRSATHSVSLAEHWGANAGFKVSFCTPSRNIGVCITGSVNVVDFTIDTRLTFDTTLVLNEPRAGSVGRLSLTRDYEVRLLSGFIELYFAFFPFNALGPFPLFRWNGFSLAVLPLELTVPTHNTISP